MENPRLDAEVLLCAVLDKSRIQLYTNFDEPLEEQELKQYRVYVARRAAREPVAYILGHKGFLQYDFKVTQDTLIPRPETELLVEQLVRLTKDRGPLRILDLGCGSGRDTKYFLEHGYRVDAIDGSAELCALASEYTGIPVKCQLFQELDASEVYDGIWACSSLLHLSYGELDEVLYRIEKALKPQGILYMSFKHGVFEGERNG